MAITSINPATGDELQTYDEMSAEEVRDILEAGHRAHLAWREVCFAERAEHMRRAAEVLREHEGPYAELMCLEMGKPIRAGRSEVEKCAWVCDYYAERAERFLADEPTETESSKSYVHFEPLGLVLAIMPWNFPLWQVFRFAAPALMAGNAGVLKHAENVPGCALAIEDVFRRAGFPEGLFRSLMVTKDEVSWILEHPRVVAATLTGSVGAGRAVAAQAGQQLKKTVLELGGSDAYVVLEDADLAKAAETCVESRLINSGQSCIAAKRFVVVKPLKEEFERLVVERMTAKVMGDPTEESTDIGPQARHDLRDDLHRQVSESVEKGARCLLGGEVPEGPGAFYPATVLTDVAPGMPAYGEELFGPVASILEADDEDDAVRIANDSDFGLGAAVFTEDVERGEEIAASRLRAGCCFVNDFVRSDPRLPFGGVKDSGYGRELSAFGIREFVNVKTVVVA